MPIRINLLAEAKVAEEQRRKDPVKRATFAAAFLVSLVALWTTTLQFKIIAAGSELNRLESRWKDIQKNYEMAVETQQRAFDAEAKLAALNQLTTNRFLWGTALNALQETLTGVDDIQVLRVKTDQAYAVTEEVKGRKTETLFIPSRPATSIERISITLDATDSSAQPGGSVSKFKDTIAGVPYFQNSLQKTNGVLLTSLSAPQPGPNGRPQVTFTLQCFFPEKVR
jgi:hypothetical protein